MWCHSYCVITCFYVCFISDTSYSSANSQLKYYLKPLGSAVEILAGSVGCRLAAGNKITSILADKGSDWISDMRRMQDCGEAFTVYHRCVLDVVVLTLTVTLFRYSVHCIALRRQSVYIFLSPLWHLLAARAATGDSSRKEQVLVADVNGGRNPCGTSLPPIGSLMLKVSTIYLMMRQSLLWNWKKIRLRLTAFHTA